ncbi:hypothetical protein [Sulfobacillus thermosulfidooxidans]|uniref:hypothetical protein n=1 Tax=Sulfobacillus thermosulfidooxidans TaxID=28034 RepID=UPI0006B4CF33|nr:hypothetical protein [Sulfobacillus thermosulfidooxidans]
MTQLSKTMVLNLIDQQLAQISPTATRVEISMAIGTLLADFRTMLPSPYSESATPPPTQTRALAIPVLKETPVEHVVGDAWLFHRQDTWPSTVQHWQRVAVLLLNNRQQIAQADQAKQVVRQKPITGTFLKNGSIWIDDGLRRVYALWLLGSTTIPIWIVDEEADAHN